MQTSAHSLIKTSIASLIVIVLSGCSTMGGGNPPAAKKLSDHVVRPAAVITPKSAPGRDASLDVYNQDGKLIHLNPKTSPVLLEAYWCPHCQRTLKLLFQHESEFHTMPIIVSTGFVQGTTLKTAEKLTHDEWNLLQFPGTEQVYYQLDTREQPDIYPTLVYKSHKGLQIMEGEYTVSAWQTVLGRR